MFAVIKVRIEFTSLLQLGTYYVSLKGIFSTPCVCVWPLVVALVALKLCGRKVNRETSVAVPREEFCRLAIS